MDTDGMQAPGGYPMRRRDRELSRQEAENILRRGEYGILCTCGQNGIPYGIPLNYVYREGCICFHSATEGHKVQNLQQNKQASFTVVGATRTLPRKFSTLYESAIAFGPVIQVEGEQKLAILEEMVSKYCPGYREQGASYISHDSGRTCVFALRIEQLSGKAHR